jgi:hypothetical protein
MSVTNSYDDGFTLLVKSIVNNPFLWFFFLCFLVVLNSIGWYYRYSLLGDAFNKNFSTIGGTLGDLAGIIFFRIFEYVCIFAFFIWIYKYGK